MQHSNHGNPRVDPWFSIKHVSFWSLTLLHTITSFCFGDYQAAIPHPPGGRQGVLLRGKVPLYHFIKTPVEPPGRMTAAVEASSIRAPDDPVSIHYSTAPVPRALQLPSTTFLSHGRLSLAPPPPARADADGPRGPAQAWGRPTRCPAARQSSRPAVLSTATKTTSAIDGQPISSDASHFLKLVACHS